MFVMENQRDKNTKQENCFLTVFLTKQNWFTNVHMFINASRSGQTEDWIFIQYL